MLRFNNRAFNALRPTQITTGVNKYAEGSCLIECGDTKVLCMATLEEKVPMWLKNTPQGWVTAEYGMLPRATSLRVEREAKKGQTGRTEEIQRLIGRSLRAAVDLSALTGFTIKIDCDVLQADGGTRCASITGGFIALYLACQKYVENNKKRKFPITHFVSAVSCGLIQNDVLLDLDFQEDSNAGCDTNFVFTDTDELVEISATAEHQLFNPVYFNEMMQLAQKGCHELSALQKIALGV